MARIDGGVALLAAFAWAAGGLAFAREIPAANPAALEAAIAAAQPGDTILLADGEWKDVEVEFRARGTAGQPVTLRAQTPGKAALVGHSSLRFIGEHLVVEGLVFRDGCQESGHVIAFRGDSDEESHHCRLTQCAIIDYNSPAGGAKGSFWISLYGTHNRVDHCCLRGKTNASPMLVVWLNGSPTHHRIDANYFAGRPALGKNGGETIRVGDSKTSMQNAHTTVEHNLFENCDGEAEIISNKSCENTYRHNTFVRSAGALVLRHGNRCLVEGNYFFGGGKESTAGIRVFGDDHRIINNYLCDLTGEKYYAAMPLMAGKDDSPLHGAWPVRRALIAFNTFVNCRQNIVIGNGTPKTGTIAPRGCVFANNLIFGKNAPLITTLLEPAAPVWQGNIAFGAELGLPPQEGIRILDPSLAREPDGLWQPAAGSPARGAASGSFPGLATDILGRPRRPPLDVGCLQPSDMPRRFPPLTPDQVGPSWRKAAPGI